MFGKKLADHNSNSISTYFYLESIFLKLFSEEVGNRICRGWMCCSLAK